MLGMSGPEQIRRGASAGVRYGLLAFGAGAVSGLLRELLLAPAVGGLPAALAEGVVLAVLIPVFARSVLDRMPPRQGWQTRVAVAVAGLLVVVAAEVALALVLQASGIDAARVPRSAPERAVGPVLLLWLAAAPLLLRR